MIHIGLKIKEVVEQKGISKTELSRRLNMSATNIHKIFKRDSIDSALLQKLTLILNHDFFAYYKEDMLHSSLEEPNSEYKTRIQVLQEEIQTLTKENAYLKEINELLREKMKGA